ncbi:hypothetical protein D3C75_620890 [compost metagenome]
MNGHSVLCRDRGDFFVIRCEVGNPQLHIRFVAAHFGKVSRHSTQVMGIRGHLLGFDILPYVVFVADYVFGPGAIVGQIFIIFQQRCELRSVIDVEYFAGSIIQLVSQRQQVGIHQVEVVVLLQQSLVKLMPFPAVGWLGSVSGYAFFFFSNRFQVVGIGFRTVDFRKIVFLAQVFTVQHYLVGNLNIVVWHHVELAIHFRLLPVHFGHGFPGLRHVLGQHIICQLQESAFERLIVIKSPVSCVYEVKILIGCKFQRIFLCPVRPVKEFCFHRSIDFFLQFGVELSEHLVVIARLAADQQHFELDLFGGVRSAGIRGCPFCSGCSGVCCFRSCIVVVPASACTKDCTQCHHRGQRNCEFLFLVCHDRCFPLIE